MPESYADQSYRSRFHLPFRRRHSASAAVQPSQLEAGLAEPAKRENSHEEKIADSAQEGEFQEGKVEEDEPPQYTEEAWKLVRTFTTAGNAQWTNYPHTENGTTAANSADDLTNTHEHGEVDAHEVEQRGYDLESIPEPKNYKPSIFGALLSSKLNTIQAESWINHGTTKQASSHHQRTGSETPMSGAQTPLRWYDKPHPKSATANMLMQAGLSAASAPGLPEGSGSLPLRKSRPGENNNLVSSAVDLLNKKLGNDKNSQRRVEETKRRKQAFSAYQQGVVAEVADILARRRFLVKLAGSFQAYGAPTHRLEEYLSAASRALEIDADFSYIPGSMTTTFRDATLQTSTVDLIRVREGLDFGRLSEAINVYKLAIHEKITAQEGITELEHIQKRDDQHSVWFRILMYGVASVLVGPFSFQARPIDLVPIFFLGCALGFLNLRVVPKSTHFSNVFEVSAAVMIAFIARGLGSIRVNGEYLFCFSATASSGIALLLPGFMMLNSALELQGRSIVAGSVRLVWTIIYVLFLSFGMLIGMTVYGLIDRNAVTTTTCRIPSWWEAQGAKLLYTNFVWVPFFACSIAKIYKAKWKQLPIMALVSVCGYQAYYWVSTVTKSNPQVASAVGSFTVGVASHLYSRLFHGVAATTMLPAIYCLVPGGLAASGSLVAGVHSSTQLTSSAQSGSDQSYNQQIYQVGTSMVNLAIALSCGLYLSALVCYPVGKKRSGLFSF